MSEQYDSGTERKAIAEFEEAEIRRIAREEAEGVIDTRMLGVVLGED